MTQNGTLSDYPAPASTSKDIHDQALDTVECQSGCAAATRLGSSKKCNGRASTWVCGFLHFVGPGAVVAIAYLDPGNLAADVNQGASGGYTLLWVTLWATIFAWIIQSIAAVMGLCTEQHLAQHCRAYYPFLPRWFMFIAMEIAVLGTDMMEVIGGAIAVNGLSNGAIPLWASVLITCVVAYALLTLAEFIERGFLQFFMSGILLVLVVMFVILFARTDQQAGPLFKGLFVPSLSGSNQIQAAVGCIGAIIMPHNLFLGSAIVLTRRARVNKAMSKVSIRTVKQYVWVETAVMLVVALTINVLAISVFAATKSEVVDQYADTNGTIGVMSIGSILQIEYGKAYEIIWYVGLLASAQASTMTTTYAGSFILSGFLNLDVEKHSWWLPYVVRMVTMAPALAISFVHTNDGYAEITNWLNQINSLTLPYALIPLFVIACSTTVMGLDAALRWWQALIAGAITLLIIALNVYGLSTRILDAISSSWGLGLAFTGLSLYILSFLYFAIPPPFVRKTSRQLKKQLLGQNITEDDAVEETALESADETGAEGGSITVEDAVQDTKAADEVEGAEGAQKGEHHA